MNILLDQGVPAPLKSCLAGHEIKTAYECGWSALKNGDLLAAADSQFDILITTDQNLRYQQDLSDRRISIVVLMTTRWPVIRAQVDRVVSAVAMATVGSYYEVRFEV